MIKKNKGIDIWPKRNFPRLNSKKTSSSEVENLLAKMFNGGFPVVLSSGRSAIYIASKLFWKNNNIHVFPYASQCVVMALQRAGISVCTKIDFKSDISIDQWGILDKNCKERIFIEDSCDTFLEKGSRVLELDAEFQVWSLPKIIGSRFGAVLWCKDENSAFVIRKFRDENSSWGKYFKKLLRNARNLNESTYQAWENFEFRNIGLTSYEYGTLFKNLTYWDDIYINRKASYQKTKNTLELNFPNDFLNLNNGAANRIPTLFYSKNWYPASSLNQFRHSGDLHRVTFGARPDLVKIYSYLRKS